MTYRDTNDKGEEVTWYSDGLIFVDKDKDPFGIDKNTITAGGGERGSKYFNIEEGLWYMNVPFRLPVYTATQILEENYLDIDRRLVCNPCYLYLETEFEIDLTIGNGFDRIEKYYDMTFLDEKGALDLLKADLSIFDKGNMYTLYTKIQLVDKFIMEDG